MHGGNEEKSGRKKTEIVYNLTTAVFIFAMKGIKKKKLWSTSNYFKYYKDPVFNLIHAQFLCQRYLEKADFVDRNQRPSLRFCIKNYKKQVCLLKIKKEECKTSQDMATDILFDRMQKQENSSITLLANQQPVQSTSRDKKNGISVTSVPVIFAEEAKGVTWCIKSQRTCGKMSSSTTYNRLSKAVANPLNLETGASGINQSSCSSKHYKLTMNICHACVTLAGDVFISNAVVHFDKILYLIPLITNRKRSVDAVRREIDRGTDTEEDDDSKKNIQKFLANSHSYISFYATKNCILSSD
ncbi:hypothetical protein EGR_06263 [Echinococcus granulosus]|uniref:Uncharacterized protein n=1 Tax=Echinococcus granulosus TaxID=6210 RepID=W6UZ22_ECHGR|nr:hypothetical protein EGR_06263 [Echinococcus granulosus]EUB58839.1 hypothetical protein EGR_06263 [Echinococcus granulosus]